LSGALGCSSRPNNNSSPVEPPAGSPQTNVDAAQIIQRYKALDGSRDSTIKIRADVTEGASQDASSAKHVQLTFYKKRMADGQRVMLVEFTSPSEERDRDGLITEFPDGRIEGLRYVQSTNGYIATDDVVSEDGLFGLTLQELADGQPEKYDFSVVGQESVNNETLYRLDGKLKPGSQSKFPRLTLLIDSQNNTVREATFYDNHNEIARKLTVRTIEQIGGFWTRTAWTIENRARQKTIDFKAADVKYDQGLKDSLFTREHLAKLASR